MSVDARLTHAASEARRSAADVALRDIEAAARAMRMWRALAAAMAVSAVVALIAAGTMLLSGTGGGSEVVDQPSTTIPDPGRATPPLFAGTGFDAGWTPLRGPIAAASWTPGRLENGRWVGFENGMWTRYENGWLCRHQTGDTPSSGVCVDTAGESLADAYTHAQTGNDRFWTSAEGLIGLEADNVEVLWSYGDDGWVARPVEELQGRDVMAAGGYYVRAGLLWVWLTPTTGEDVEVWNTPDGENWRRVTWDGPPPEGPDWRITRSGDTILVDSRRGHFYRSGDGGRSFASVAPPDAGLIWFWFVWAHDGGFRAIPNSEPPELWHSPDGATWHSLGPVSGLDWIEPGYTPFPQQLSTDPSSGTVLIGDLWRVNGCWGDVYRSTDGGLSWQPLEVVESLLGLSAESRSGSTCWSSAPGDHAWMLVNLWERGTQGSGVWGSRNGTDWYHFGAQSELPLDYNTYPVVDDGVMIPPAP